MKILSINVNNFGGTNDKPLVGKYKLPNGEPDFKLWNQAVDDWRIKNKACILKNVAAITGLAKDFDIIFLHEVDTNCFSWENLLKEMSPKYEWKPANGIEKSVYNTGRKSISCVFVKKDINFEYKDENIWSINHRNVEIKVGDTHIIGLHMSYNLDEWDKLISKFKTLREKKLLIIGDLNVFDEGTERRKRLDEILNEGAIDIWLAQGECNNVPTANTNKRIDYALSTQELYKEGVHEIILNYIRHKKYTDHAAIAVAYNTERKI